MRIVGGDRRGARLAAPPGTDLRPTADRTREAVFNILTHGIDNGDPADQVVLDAFAGIGAMGLEALSRGAARAAFLDNGDKALDAVRANLRRLSWEEHATVVRADATTTGPPPLSVGPCGLVFLDPPYRSGLAAPALANLAARGWLADSAVCVVEVAAREDFEPPAGFTPMDERRYGAAKVVFLRGPEG